MHQEKISGDARAEIKKPVAEVREPRLNTLLSERPVFQKPIIGN
jgi:hypothetical protein